MRPGTPQFVGERLREAREARGLTALALAELIGVSRQAVSQYENGPQTPAPTVMQRIASALRLPIHYFLRAVSVTTDGVIFYRSMSATTKSARARAESRFKWTREIVRYLRVFVNLPKVNYPVLDLPADPLAISERMIEDAATATRRSWRLGDGPISNVVLLLENSGTIVVRHNIEADEIDAFSMWSPEEQSPYIVLNSGKGVAVRSRFDAAHELGHLLLHRKVLEGSLSRPEMFSLIEKQAHLFASAFLMPESTFASDAISPSLDSFRALKPKWKVSIQAMMKRAKGLRLISPEQETRLWANLARRGWRTAEPLDDSIEPEVPRLLRRSVELLMSSGATTRQDLVFQNALLAEDVEQLIGLTSGYLTATNEEGQAGEPTIIRFPSAG